MAGKPKPKPKLTDADRHKRFVKTAREIDASEDPKDFDKAFKAVTVKAPNLPLGGEDGQGFEVS